MFEINGVFGSFLLSLIVLTIYISLDTGFGECHANYVENKRTGFYQIISPEKIVLALSFIMIVVSSIRIVNDRIVVLISVIVEFLNGFVLFSYLYMLIRIARIYMNDTKCTLNNNKYNGISGHFFTYIFFFQLMTHLAHSFRFELKQPLTSVIATETFQYRFERIFSLSLTPFQKIKPSFQTVFVLMLFFGCYIFSWGTLFDTIVIGYHTPQQVTYGIVLGVLAVFVHQLFVQIPFAFQSPLNIVCLVLVSVTYSFVSNSVQIGSAFLFGSISFIVTLLIEYYNAHSVFINQATTSVI